jgi:hypothetical protein
MWLGPVNDWKAKQSRGRARRRRTSAPFGGNDWHGSQLTPEEATPILKRLRRDRPEPEFTISMRTHWNGKDQGELRERIAAYEAIGVQHDRPSQPRSRRLGWGNRRRPAASPPDVKGRHLAIIRGDLRLNMDDGFGWRRTPSRSTRTTRFFMNHVASSSISMRTGKTFGALIERVEEWFEPSVPANGSPSIG